MALELEGTLAQKLPVQSGNSARGPWAKQEFILEYPDGMSFNLKSREYNGRWYNDLQIWKIAPAGAQPAAPVQQPAPQAKPAPQAAAWQQAPAPTLEDMPADSEGAEDLPF